MLVVTVAGCGGSALTIVPLTGTIKLDGEPLPFKSLMLVPADGTPGHGAGGYSDGKGIFTLRAIVPGAVKDFPGCPPGKYQVVVSEPRMPLSDADFADAAMQVVTETDEPAPAIILMEMAPKEQVKGSIPAMYTSNLTSPLTIEVAEGIEVVNLELVSK